jgi:hypothetical protein
MNSLHEVVKNDDGNAVASLARTDALREKVIHVLSLGPVGRGNLVHDALFELPSFRLSIVRDYRELWMIPKQKSIHVVILHNTISAPELEDAGRFIRRRWPHARILLVCAGPGLINDALYDDRVAPTVAPEVLLKAIERLIGGRDEQRFGIAEL